MPAASAASLLPLCGCGTARPYSKKSYNGRHLMQAEAEGKKYGSTPTPYSGSSSSSSSSSGGAYGGGAYGKKGGSGGGAGGDEDGDEDGEVSQAGGVLLARLCAHARPACSCTQPILRTISGSIHSNSERVMLHDSVCSFAYAWLRGLFVTQRLSCSRLYIVLNPICTG